MSDFTMSYSAEKIFVHRWPHDTPVWGDSVKSHLDDSVNKKQGKKKSKVIGIDVSFFESTNSENDSLLATAIKNNEVALEKLKYVITLVIGSSQLNSYGRHSVR